MDSPFVLFLLGLALVGSLPLWVSLAQFLLIGVHGVRNHLGACGDYCPRVVFVIPAWNEAASLPATIDALMQQDYPAGQWRIVVVDDASTDGTGTVLAGIIASYPGCVRHLRRELGGEGKAHTLNHGLEAVLTDDWAQAVMIMDADVLFEPTALRRMARHLADPDVGAVTAYIKEGSHPASLVGRFIAFEYITSQAAARRSQNVIGALACMAGGAQLHSRENLERIGGSIDTSTLAEDTFTTLRTQLRGRLALFEGNAVVWAEEPASLSALWKQRLRWARGNLQLTSAFRGMWFRPWRNRRVGGLFFGLQWFVLLYTPLFILSASVGLTGLVALGSRWAFGVLSLVWGLTIATYVFQTLFSLLIDPAAGRRTWLQGLLFPGLVSLAIMSLMVLGRVADIDIAREAQQGGVARQLVWVASLWPSLALALTWAIYRLDRIDAPAWLRDTLLLIIGYGPLMSAISLAALIAEIRGVDRRWEKTVKHGRARMLDVA